MLGRIVFPGWLTYEKTLVRPGVADFPRGRVPSNLAPRDEVAPRQFSLALCSPGV